MDSSLGLELCQIKQEGEDRIKINKIKTRGASLSLSPAVLTHIEKYRRLFLVF